MVGAVMVPFVIGFNGYILGLIISCGYSLYGLMGIVFNLLIIIPPSVISSIALILSSRESLGFSISLARLALPDFNKHQIEGDFKLYCLRQLFLLIFYPVSAIINALLATSFISFFNFK